MQQNYFKLLGAPVVWDNTSQYQIVNAPGIFGTNYQYIPQVLDGGDLYYANGTSTPTIGLAPASDSAWTAITGGAAGMLALPNQQIYVGNAANQPAAVPMTGDVTISNSGATFITDTTVTGKTLTGFSATPGIITDDDTILTGIEKNAGNLAASSTFTPGVGTPQINYTVDAIAKIVTYNIYDGSQFNTITNGAGPTTPVTYTLPQPSQGNVGNIIGIKAFIQSAFVPTSASTGNINAWASAVSNTTPSITIVAMNTTDAPITDGTMWVTVVAALA